MSNFIHTSFRSHKLCYLYVSKYDNKYRHSMYPLCSSNYKFYSIQLFNKLTSFCAFLLRKCVYCLYTLHLYLCTIFHPPRCRRTSGSIIRHLLYDTRLFIHTLRSFVMHCDLGSTPANLYFHILYLMNIFDSIYNTVASIEPISLPSKKELFFVYHSITSPVFPVHFLYAVTYS